MPLTDFQREVLAVIVANRSEESHFAGGLVLNATPESPRSLATARRLAALRRRRWPQGTDEDQRDEPPFSKPSQKRVTTFEKQ